jgi:hypothetical protein
MQMRSLAYSDGIDKYSLKLLLSHLFKRPKESKSVQRKCAISLDKLATELDVKRDILHTALCYIELHDLSPLSILSSTHLIASFLCRFSHSISKDIQKSCTVRFIRTKPQELAKSDTLIEAILTKGKLSRYTCTFDALEV